ncbi:MAG: hypothetical protein A2271_02050 [Candidatus Moranbacteria bacterium RIFOXYA12_FULL_35_19]|nr:MAG: hypothetical protein UR78_C0022G0002 [Candidatus Moranbacteria bacterium GW2011_GWF2_35_39]OGI32085.1 MAG: hypothetical protein A2489_01610 [Candidatus Moranbacteria bacterium RIFOXYC12_FULL_36_13]OGI32448.1 MAG: hypothetical protein A2343_03760 [Candidatus Moranbacteria bacterium RIFOXYB12_FULL_35_8]OGI36745.1 MAG: hypothetical protein A2271_02050 [Candidatus Moranbacteria bacterium RIFOXYA12_FULL_35_19]
MADGKLCKTCGWQESEHIMLLQTLNKDKLKRWIGVPSFRKTRTWGRKKIQQFLIKNGMKRKDIEEYFYDVIRCPGFSTTRKRNKNWRVLSRCGHRNGTW